MRFSCSVIAFSWPVLPKPQVSYKTTSPGVIEANCTAVARPKAEIVWNVEGDNRTLGPPVSTVIQQEDGTMLVISTLTVQTGLLKDVSVKCLVHHKGLESAIAVSMNTKSEWKSFICSEQKSGSLRVAKETGTLSYPAKIYFVSKLINSRAIKYSLERENM